MISLLTNRVYCIDCLEGLRKLPDNSIDVIFTSPPYNKAGYEGHIRKAHSSDNWKRRNIDYDEQSDNDFMPEEEYEAWQIAVLNECHRVLKSDGSLFYNHKVRLAHHRASHPIEWCIKSKLCFRQQLIWDRGSSLALAPIRFLPITELVLWFTKEPVQPNFSRKSESKYKTEILSILPSRGSIHPATYPVELVSAVLEHIDNREGSAIVLDPFMGSGSTALAAIANGFQFIGFDSVDKYVDLANKAVLERFYESKDWVYDTEGCEHLTVDLAFGRAFDMLSADEVRELQQLWDKRYHTVDMEERQCM